MPNYTVNNKTFTEKQVVDQAAKLGVTLEDYLANTGLKLELAGSNQQELPEDKGWFEDMLTAIRGGSAAGSSVGESFDVYRQGRNISDEDLQNFIKAAQAIENNPETNESASWRKDTKKHGGGFLGGLMGLLENPGYAPQFIASSLATMGSSLFDSEEVAAFTAAGAGTGALIGKSAGALAGSVGGPIGTGLGYIAGAGAGAIGGGMAGLVGAMETGLTLTDLLRDELGDKEFNQENIRALLNDKDVMDRVTSRSLARGLTIGAVEGLTFGLSRGVGGKILASAATKGAIGLSKAGLKTGAKVAAATTAVEAVGGGGGEALGMLAAGQELKGEEIFLEAIGEGKGVFNTSDFVRSALTKTSYKLNKEEVSADKIRKIIENPNTSNADLAEMNIEVTGDNIFDNFVKQKQNNAAIDTQIDARITDKADRQKLVELELKRRKAKADIEKKGAFKVLNAEQVLLDVENEIETLLNKYEGAVGFGETTEAKKVAKVLRDISLNKTIEFLQKNKKFVGKDVIIAENDVDAKIAYDKAVEEYNAKIDSGEIKADKIVDEYSSSDGFILGDVIVINKDVAGQTGAISVGSHELLHAIVSKHMKSLDTAGKIKLGKNFMNTLTKNQSDAVRKRLKESYNLEGDAVFASEEIFTAFSDAIAKNEITFDEGVFDKLKNIVEEILRKVGIRKEFANGRQVYNFLKDYQKSVAAGGEISARAKSLADGGTYAMGAQASKSTPLEAINKLLPGNITTQEDYYKVLNDPRIARNAGVDRILDNKGNLAPVIEAYIRSKSTSSDMANENIKSVKKRLANFDPEETREDGSIVGQEFGEFIFANARFGKLDAAKNLAIKAEKEKKTTRLDDPDVKDIADKDKKTTGTSNVKTKLVQTKARQLTSLADLDVESETVIIDGVETTILKDVTKAELAKLIESNPKNIVQEIQSVLIPDLVEIIRKQMGVIGQVKGKLNIPDSYKDYLSETYQKTISSMEILKIRTNYKNLFKKEKMGFADYKTEKSNKPSLKKDSNYRKDIFRNVTTKAEFIKYHTEGKKNKLIANQRNLALMRAEAEAVRAAENYIQNNSTNPGQLFGSSLRTFVDSKTIEKQKQEDKSFDSVKYSKQKINTALAIADAYMSNKNVFDNYGKLLPPYNGFLKNKKDMEEIGDFIWANTPLLQGYESWNQFMARAYDKLAKAGERGTDYEKNLIDVALILEKRINDPKVFKVISKKPSEKDALPDVVVEIHGVQMNIEAKMFSAQYGSFTHSVIDYLGKQIFNVKKEYSKPLEKILKELEAETLKGIDIAKKFLKSPKDSNGNPKKVIEWDGIKKIPIEGHNQLINNINPNTGSSYFNGMSATVPFPLKYIAELYNLKKHQVHLIQLMGRGLFSMGGDIYQFGLTSLESGGDGFVTMRVGSNSYKTAATEADAKNTPNKSMFKNGKNGKKWKVTRPFRTYSFRSFPGISPQVLNDMQSPQSIGNVAGLQKIINDKRIQMGLEAIKFSKTLAKRANESQELYNAVNFSRTVNKPKGITVLDFDDTLATTKSLVKYTTPDGKTGTLNAEQYASTYESLLDQGYEFDFSDFNKVVKGKLAPLFNKAIKLQDKFGPENMFVLTARPAAAQQAIFDFLKANGLNIPLKNITGLGNSTAEAKALWVADKVGEGYNDFYFADDALQNVQAVKNMLDQFDVKSKVQQARVKFSNSMSDNFNDILETLTGIESKKKFDFIKARKRGASKGKFRFFIPPSHEDFVGLLYNFMGKGVEGNKHRDFFEQALVRPLNRANKEYDTARQSVATDYKNLNKQMPDVKKILNNKTPDGDFVYQDAIRVYLWDKHGYNIPGLSPIDQKNLVDLVNSDPSLKSYAESINAISKQEKYVDPTDGWDSGDIRMDLDDATGRIGRAQFFTEFVENADIIFSKENLNKIEAGYGKGMREALEDMLYRIKTGRNKPTGQSGMVNRLMNWVNGSVGSVMFFNIRSALLQQMSIVNYINFADNNIFAAAKAFANQKQYWADWAFIFNSDMLKQRRGGIMTDVNGAELAAEMRKSKNPHRFLISKLLELGFLPTQIGDNIAIATGGATYYRNRINAYLRQGLSKAEAEAKAFTDFQDITQSTQQSARPDMVSQQQASIIGKIILNFQNVTSQFNRLGKKAFLDIKNRRITKPNTTQMQSDISNAARITYYFAVQNAIFYTLQTALFAMMFDDDEEDNNNLFLKKRERLINGSIDSVLRGSGILGGVISTLKNVAIAFARQRDVNYNPDESAVIVEALNFSPVIGIKARKVVNAEKTLNYNKKVIKEMENTDIDNPQWSAVTNYIEGFTNLPLNRLYQKTQNIRQGFNNDHSAWERMLLFLGWSQYNLNLENEKMDKIKENTNQNKKTKYKPKYKSKYKSKYR